MNQVINAEYKFRLKNDESVSNKHIFSKEKIFEYLIYGILSIGCLSLNYGIGSLYAIPLMVILRKLVSKKFFRIAIVLSLATFPFDIYQGLLLTAFSICLMTLFSSKRTLVFSEVLLTEIFFIGSYLVANTLTYDVQELIYCIGLNTLLLYLYKGFLSGEIFRKNITGLNLSESIAVIVAFTVWLSGLFIYNIGNINVGYTVSIIAVLLVASLLDGFLALLLSLSIFFVFSATGTHDGLILLPIISLIYSKHNYQKLMCITLHIASILVAFTLGGIGDAIIEIYIMNVIAMLVYFVLPKTKIQTQLIIKSDNFEEINDKAREDVVNKLINFSEIFDVFADNNMESNQSLTALDEAIDDVVCRHCKKCIRRDYCHNKNYIKTYYYLNRILKEGEYVLNESHKQFLELFSKYCVNAFDIINSCVELNQDLKIDSRSNQDTVMFDSYLKGISSILRKYAYNFSKSNMNNYLIEKLIKQELYKEGFDIKYIRSYSLVRNNIHVEIGSKKISDFELDHIMRPIMKHIFKEDVLVENYNSGNGITVLRIVSQNRYNTQFGASYIGKNGARLSGDNYLKRELSSGHTIVALSDGMGNGYSAHQESRTTLELLNKIINTNIDSNTTITIINTLIALKEYNERFSTLDFLSINRNEGTAQFYKIGATASFILRGMQVHTINNSNPPIGIEVDIRKNEYQIRNNDYIFMVSDGVIERLADVSDFEKIIQSVEKSSCNQIAHDVMNDVITQLDGDIPDDMIVIVVKIEALKETKIVA